MLPFPSYSKMHTSTQRTMCQMHTCWLFVCMTHTWRAWQILSLKVVHQPNCSVILFKTFRAHKIWPDMLLTKWTNRFSLKIKLINKAWHIDVLHCLHWLWNTLSLSSNHVLKRLFYTTINSAVNSLFMDSISMCRQVLLEKLFNTAHSTFDLG